MRRRMGLVAKEDDWRIPDVLRILPEHRTDHPLGCHRPRVPNRDAMNAILFVLRTGCQWNALYPIHGPHVVTS
jgi:transposase